MMKPLLPLSLSLAVAAGLLALTPADARPHGGWQSGPSAAPSGWGAVEDRRWNDGRWDERRWDDRRWDDARWDDRRWPARSRGFNGRRGAFRCRDEGTGGAVVGAIAGGLIGNQLARRGDRTLGTLVGGVGGALLGREIDRADGRPC